MNFDKSGQMARLLLVLARGSRPRPYIALRTPFSPLAVSESRTLGFKWRYGNDANPIIQAIADRSTNTALAIEQVKSLGASSCCRLHPRISQYKDSTQPKDNRHHRRRYRLPAFENERRESCAGEPRRVSTRRRGRPEAATPARGSESAGPARICKEQHR